MNLRKLESLIDSILVSSTSTATSITDTFHTGIRVSLFRMGANGEEPYTSEMQMSDAIGILIGGNMVHMKRQPGSRRTDEPILDDRSCMIVLSCDGWQPLEATIYPAPSADLNRRLLSWLGEPMPETWLFGCAQDPSNWKFDRIISPAPIPIREIREDAYGLFELALPFRTVPCVTAWQVCPAGTTRFDLLLRADQLMAHPLNPYTSPLFRDNDVVPTIFHFRHNRYDSTFSVPVWPGRNSAAIDMLVLAAALLGYTELSPSDLAALVASWGVAAAWVLHEMASDTAFRTSPLLLTHTVSAMSELERKLVLGLLSKTARLRASKSPFPPHDIGVTATYHVMDASFVTLYVSDYLFSYRDVFNTWMVVRAQLGLPTVSFEQLNYERYLQLLAYPT